MRKVKKISTNRFLDAEPKPEETIALSCDSGDTSTIAMPTSTTNAGERHLEHAAKKSVQISMILTLLLIS